MYLYSDGRVGDYMFWDDFVMKLLDLYTYI